MIGQIETGSPKIVGFKLSGKLHDEDYKSFVPAVNAALASEGKVRIFAQFEDFHGWDLHAAWDDFKFGVRHYSAFDRIAMVGDGKWEALLVTMCRPFTRAKVKHFNAAEADAAWSWLREGIQAATSA